jgi:hypothetical protein
MIKFADLLLEGTVTDANIIRSVTNKRIVSFYYKGDKEEKAGFRTGVKPVCFGSRKGIKYIRAWQDSGKTVTKVPAWKFFRMDRIINWNVSNKNFTAPPRADFNPNGDKHMDHIIAISDFKPGEQEAPSDLTPPVTPTPPTPGSAGGNKPIDKKEPSASTNKPTGTQKTEPTQKSNKPVKGPARPGAKAPSSSERRKKELEKKSSNKKNPTNKKDNMSESVIVNVILDAVSIF